jgi:translation initiation factor 4E
MTAYFSNQSRIASADATAQTRARAASTAAGSGRPPAPPPPRMQTSKHFSTTVAPAADAGKSPVEGVHPLRITYVRRARQLQYTRLSILIARSWVFWFRQQRAPGDKIRDYEEGIKRIGAVSSVESFWRTLTHLAPPSALLPTTDYLLFHAGVRRPVWEDPANARGGKWILRLRKGVADRLWEDLLLAVAGDQFADGELAARAEDGWPEICGASISVRLNEDIISLWNRFEADVKSRDRIKCVRPARVFFVADR